MNQSMPKGKTGEVTAVVVNLEVLFSITVANLGHRKCCGKSEEKCNVMKRWAGAGPLSPEGNREK